MYCTTPEEQAMLELLKAAYPESDVYQLELNVWMYFNKRDEYIKIMDECMAKHGDNPELINVDDERFRAIYPEDIKMETPILTTPEGEEIPAPTLDATIEE
jgi:hypothetical protein